METSLSKRFSIWKIAFTVIILPLLSATNLSASSDFPIGIPHLLYLENGLEVLLIENHTTPMIAATAIIRVGSSDEDADLRGATHFLEHLLFDGTETRSQQDIEDAFDRLSGYNNAQTAKEHTAFMILAEKEKFAEALDLQSDMLLYSVLPPEQIEKEKGIVIEEIGQGISNDPEYMIYLAFNRLAWEGTPYVYPVLGTRESVEAMEREKLFAYYKQHYTPDNMSLLVIGDFHPREMTKLLEETYGKARPGKRVAFRKEAPRLSPSWNPVRLLGDGTHLWLTFPWELIRGAGRLEPVEALLPDILDAIIGDTLRERFKGDILILDWSWEINRSGTQLQLRMELSPEADPDYILNFLQLKLMTLDPTSASLNVWRDKANATIDDAIHYSQRYHFFGMLQAAEIAQGSCRLWAQNMREMVAFRDMLESARVGSPGIMKTVSEAVPLVVIFTPPPAETEETALSFEKTDTTLANGLRLIIKSESSMPVFAAHFLFQGRSAFEGPERMGWVDMLHRLMDYGNPPSLGQAELQRRLDSLRLRWKLVDHPYIPFDNYYTQPDFSFIRLSGPTPSQQAGLALMYELLSSDALSPSDLEAVRNEMYGLIQRAERSPRAKAGAMYKQALLGAHPYAQSVSGNTATISAPDPFDLRQFRKDYFRPNHLILSIVTSESINKTVAMVEAVFGEWQLGDPLPEIPVPPTPRDSNATITVGARQAQVILGAFLPGFPESQVSQMGLWTGLLSDKLQQDLRETRGLAYSVGAYVSHKDGWGWLTLQIGTRAENVPQAVAGMKEWVGKLQNTPLDKSELEKVQASQRGRRLMRRMARDQQAFQLGLAAMRGQEPFAETPATDPNPEAIGKTARELLKSARWVQIIVE